LSASPRAAVALFIFNRPDTTRAVVRALRAVRPPVLYVVADGPRPGRADDLEGCRAARGVIDAGVDWPCDVRWMISGVNQGCDGSVPSGVSWVLSREDRAVFLEDDCVPEPTFFRFCDEIFERYRDDPRVSQVCGTNRSIRWKADRQSYHFAYYGSSWGWGTWRRAWTLFDPLMTSWDDPALQADIEARIEDAQEYRYFVDVCSLARRQPHAIWDYAWAFAQIARGGLTVVPSVNLVTNIGFGPGATHTARRPLSELQESQPMTFPLRSPPTMSRDREYDHAHFLWAIGRPEAASAADFGRRLLRRGRVMEALALVDAPWRADPGRRDVALVRAEALLALGRPHAGAEVLARLLAVSPGDTEVIAMLDRLTSTSA
jgi:hypothetical protein